MRASLVLDFSVPDSGALLKLREQIGLESVEPAKMLGPRRPTRKAGRGVRLDFVDFDSWRSTWAGSQQSQA
jgi:hypothetical protein